MKRATPGGYGGKPPGVAIIGAPTGARSAGSGALTGDQSTDMNGSRPTPRMCQDLLTTNLVTPFLQHAYRLVALHPQPGPAPVTGGFAAPAHPGHPSGRACARAATGRRRRG